MLMCIENGKKFCGLSDFYVGSISVQSLDYCQYIFVDNFIHFCSLLFTRKAI